MSDNFNEKVNYGVGVVSGCAVYKLTPSIARKQVTKYFNKSVLIHLNTKDSHEFWQKANQACEDGLIERIFNKEKGEISNNIRIMHIDNSNMRSISEIIWKDRQKIKNNPIKNSFLYKFLYGDPVKKINQTIEAAAKGVNAFCILDLSKSSKGSKNLKKGAKKSLVIVNKDKFGYSTFHEIGHAVNRIQPGNMRRQLFISYGKILMPLIFFAALFKSKPKQDEINKKSSATFINKYCGLLVSACMLPTLVEEATASFNAAKIGKAVLNNDMYKKMNKLNKRAFMTYVFGTVIAGLTAQIGIWIKNKIINRNTSA